MYSSYVATSYARIHDIAEKTGVNIEGAVSWSCEFENKLGLQDLEIWQLTELTNLSSMSFASLD